MHLNNESVNQGQQKRLKETTFFLIGKHLSKDDCKILAKISNLSSILSKSNELKTDKESSKSFLKSTKYLGEKSLNFVVKDLLKEMEERRKL